MNFFDPPYIDKAIISKASIAIKNIGLNDRPENRTKRYEKNLVEVSFNRKDGEPRTWSECALDAVADFCQRNDVYENRSQIMECAFNANRNFGAIWIRCYIHGDLK